VDEPLCEWDWDWGRDRDLSAALSGTFREINVAAKYAMPFLQAPIDNDIDGTPTTYLY